MNRFSVLGCLLAVSAFGADVRTSDLLKLVEQRYNHAQSLQVLFREDYTKTGHARRTESGVLDLRKPGRMRWDYSDPKGKLVVCDGKTFWMYTPSENQVQKAPLKETDEMEAPIAFLLGKLHFEKEFRNLESKPEGADTLITAEPKSDNLPYSAVEFLVAPDGQILHVKVTRADNSIMEYSFDQEKVNPKLDDKMFHFQVPPGVELVEAQK
ncbi:MAG TPA: outer membrane lipoprotein chaperone LolA [Bryobacteraceae bacterium]|nr:outer membrane lipoprotein chaperone LolA [Bryobacteraceae bacterium]